MKITQENVREYERDAYMSGFATEYAVRAKINGQNAVRTVFATSETRAAEVAECKWYLDGVQDVKIVDTYLT